jgi:hypothetical protein
MQLKTFWALCRRAEGALFRGDSEEADRRLRNAIDICDENSAESIMARAEISQNP